MKTERGSRLLNLNQFFELTISIGGIKIDD
jgi:hypothetical protein